MSESTCPKCGAGPWPVARNMRSTAKCGACGTIFDDAYGSKYVIGDPRPGGYKEPCSFSAALERMKKGEKMRRRGWDVWPEFYWHAASGDLRFMGSIGPPVISAADIMAEDWEPYTEESEA